MKTNRYLLAALLGGMMLCGCGHQHKQESHSHEGHSHSHAGHSHGHEGHSHNHEGHSHGEGNGDEIVMSKEKAQNAGVKVEKVVRGVFRSVIETSGHLVATQTDEASVVAPMAGVVSMSRPITDGMKVSKGEVLFTVSADNMQDGDPAKRARVAYETARDEYERCKGLLDDQLVTKAEFNAAKERYETARIAYEAIAGNKSGSKGVAVKAPAGGYIGSCNVRSGDYVGTGQLLAYIASNNRLYLQADLPARYHKALGSITSANFTTDYSNATLCTDSLNGRILSTGRTVSEGSAFIPVTFEIDGKGELIAGSFAKVYLITGGKQNAISLPLTAITEEQGIHFVYIQDDATCYHKQEVKLGMTDGKRVEIISGLKGGERVVTEGALHVRLASAANAIPGHSHSH